MDRTSIIAVTLAVGVLVGWELYYMPKMNREAAERARAAATPVPAKADVKTAQPTPGPGQPPTIQPAKPLPATEPPVEETRTKAPGVAASYEFTNIGGGIGHVALLNHQVTLNEFGSVPIGAISTQGGEGTNLAYTVKVEKGVVTCERTAPDGLRIVKKFTLPMEAGGAKDGSKEYVVRLDVTFENKGEQPYKSPNYFVSVGSAAKVHENDRPDYTAFNWFAQKMTETNVNWFGAGQVPVLGIQTSAAKEKYEVSAEGVSWAAVKSQYFNTILTSLDDKGEMAPNGKAVWARRFPLPNDPKLYGIEGALAMPGFELKPGEKREEHFNIYAGPKSYPLLKQLGDGYADIMNFGMFKLVSIFLLKMMNLLNKFLGSYAAAIVVMTFIIRGAMWPLQNKANQSMKRMQALAPKQAELKEKYKDDPARMNAEVMKLYREYGANPFSGCVPMLIQIPIFFGFFSMLGTAIELRGSHFLWVKDLSQPDTIGHIAGIAINILPLCMAGTMLIQMQLTPKSGDQMQQRMFMFMPLIFVWFCYSFASALALYYTMQNLFSIGQLYLTRNQKLPVLVKKSVQEKKKKAGDVMSQNAKETLDTMLGYLGFICEIKEFEKDGALTLQIYTPEHERLVGPHGETLEDIQFLLNRMLQAKDKTAPRVNVDVEHLREMREDSLVHKVQQLAQSVRLTGRPYHLDPMNAYDRRIVHNAFKDDPEVMTWSPPDDSRVKRITLKRRVSAVPVA